MKWGDASLAALEKLGPLGQAAVEALKDHRASITEARQKNGRLAQRLNVAERTVREQELQITRLKRELAAARSGPVNA